MASNEYDQNFYKTALKGSYSSAKRIVPLVLDLMQVRSVLDVGCGLGHFLKAFAEAGAAEIHGMDGDYVPRDMLVIDQAQFRPQDVTQPFDLGRRFDLVVSLEVAEHLPGEAADAFVARLAKHGTAVLFSAALPAQGGTGHVNERWLSYWVERFQQHGFKALDVIRPAVWAHNDVEWWYRQNCVLFAGPDAVAANPRLAAVAANPPPVLDLVHPQLYALKHGQTASAIEKYKQLMGPLSAGGTFTVVRNADGSLSISRTGPA